MYAQQTNTGNVYPQQYPQGTTPHPQQNPQGTTPYLPQNPQETTPYPQQFPQGPQGQHPEDITLLVPADHNNQQVYHAGNYQPILPAYPLSPPGYEQIHPGVIPPINADFQPPPPGYSPPEPDAEMGKDTETMVDVLDFSEQSIRKAFIKKVYSILMCQLLVTTAFISIFVYHQPTKNFVQDNLWLLYLAIATTIGCIIPLVCCTQVYRTYPANFIFLGVFTIAESFILGVLSSFYDVDEVMLAVGITAGVCLGLTLFAFQTKWDFTAMGGILVCCLMVLILFGLVCIVMPYNSKIRMFYAACGALVFSFYLIYDTQLMMGGDHKYIMSPEDYVFAAINLYLDVIQIFIYILRIVGRR